MKAEASIAIIGGGIIGASIAYNLSKRGAESVVVLEKSKFGAGSTSASLGGYRHQFSNALSIKLSKESIKIIENFKNLTDYDPLSTRDGYLFIASMEGSLAQLKRNMELARSENIPVEFLQANEMQERFPYYKFDGILGGTYCALDGHASTLAVLQGFISKSREYGAELYENTEVTGIKKSSSPPMTIFTTRGEIRAKKIIIASGAYSGLVGSLAGINIPIKPYPRKILITHSFSNGIPPMIPLIIDVDSTLGMGREGKGILMAENGPNVSSFELVFPPDYDERVVSLALRRVPALGNASISYANAGLYEMTPDSNPIVSAISGSSGLYCCAGFAGHGFMHAPIIGELMAEMVSGEKPHLDITGFDIRRFEEEGNREVTKKEGLII